MKSVNALKVAKEHGLYLKLVTAVRNFDSYNSFESKIIEGNLWIEEYSLLTNPEKIDLSQLEVPETLIKNFLDEI